MRRLTLAAGSAIALLAACTADNDDNAPSEPGPDEERALSEAEEMLDERQTDDQEETPSPLADDGA